MSKIKMTRQEWETIIHTGQEMITSHVDYLINGEGLNADGVLSELESTRIYYEAENIEIVEERSNKETPLKPNYLGCYQYECSNCKESFDSTSYRNRRRKNQPYCDVCGQKFDWSDQHE